METHSERSAVPTFSNIIKALWQKTQFNNVK